MSKRLKIGIIGFGRIGRNIFRIGYDNPNYEFVAISDLGQPEVLHYLLVRDSVHGIMKEDVLLDGNHLVVKEQNVRLLIGGSPGTIPWDAYDVDFVIDSTGQYRRAKDMQSHLDAGAKRVIVTIPPVDPIDRVVIYGVNHKDIQVSDRIISTTSSTTQVLGLMLKILDEKFSVERLMMTTVHAYTSDQPLADSVRSDLRRSRSAVENIIPNSTPSPEIVEELMPKFKGKIDGIALNVPIADGSCIDFVTELTNMPSVEEANLAVKEAAEGELKGIIGYTEDPIVSSDVIGVSESMIYDAQATMITGNQLMKTLCWYDNGWGFSKRILELIDAYSELEAKS
jgi:glyceraldehyde 3-phosphate dehydrogenase